MRSIPIHVAPPAAVASASKLPAHGLPQAPLKGRGTAWSLAHRFAVDSRERFDDGWGQLDQAVQEEPLSVTTQVLEENVKTILTGNTSPDISFDVSINP